MAFGQPNYPYYNAQSYQPAAYPQQIPSYQPRQEQSASYQQPGTIQARYVTGREEAVAAQIFPGDPFIFADLAHGRVYVKQINPQTLVPDFAEYVRVQPTQQPQEAPQQPVQEFVSVSEFKALQDKIEALEDDIASMRSAFSQPKQTSRKAVSNDE